MPNLLEYKKKIEKHLTKNTSEFLEEILDGAFEIGASDIHIEPEENSVKLRVRIDGVLNDVLSIEKNLYNNLNSRIKLLSKIKLNVSERPQDGRFSILINKNEIEIRTSSIPSEFGESFVLRLLNPKWVSDMKTLGLSQKMLKMFEKEAKKPNGMILCAGPTGSGKTTTLYSFLKEINSAGIKVITIEDPIEYHLEGISQTQVDEEKGYDFANGLKSIVRQDPDVILVGEIRDSETGKIAVQASLTGHLVLSTVHANDSASAIARLISLGEKMENIAPALNLVIGQRLVRRVCKKCKGKGCKECGSIGYMGRIGIFEAFEVDDDMENFLLKLPSIIEIRKKAISKGMATMREDGLQKVKEGITTLEEVKRVTTE